jgi:hypothetical protein
MVVEDGGAAGPEMGGAASWRGAARGVAMENTKRVIRDAGVSPTRLERLPDFEGGVQPSSEANILL